MVRISRLMVLVFALLGVQAAAQTKIDYTLSMEQPHTHYFDVEVRIEGLKQDYIDLYMPVWTPGSYLVREFARNVETFTATGGKNQALKSQKINKNTWRIFASKGETVTARYNVYAFEISVRTSFLDASHGSVNGASVFMAVAKAEKTPATLTVKPFKDWKQISTGLQPVKDNKWVLQVPDYDLLVDSPLEIGNHQILTFESAGIPHEVAMYGVVDYDADRLKKDMKAICDESNRIFGDNECKKYVFIVHCLGNGGGGLEHLNSTHLITTRSSFLTDSGYKGFLGLVAHEYFHLWNVKRIRPRALGPFDYNNENYTQMLYVSEGFTSYYDDYLVRRANLYTPDQYLGVVASNISYVENTPGTRVQSPTESSFDAWIKHYRPNENSSNATISYYSIGAVVATVLDLEILNNSKGEKSLDDVFKFLYFENYKKQNRGYTDEEFKKAVEAAAGKNLDEFFNNHVFGTKMIDYNKYFAYVGLTLTDRNAGNNDAQFGATTSSAGGRVMVTGVNKGTAAYEGGINVNDELIAIDNHRVGDNLAFLVSKYSPGDKVKVTLVRDGILQTLDITLKKNNTISYALLPAGQRTPEQETVYKKWMRLN